ncbi:hypothetical protein P170DRAFT_208403 [Aspergillus steynii IBT 23096]|uniref:Uncharacterized protein n=1 Tax=Aspergillus steynii IBT 23096 TaxID=1392250 RepID=A0A2I2G5U9_9EURO|nr:uncharacterized protein P170DRAFT_208403 [Aspergillus steynii IBT 23096]PLB48223.1 hypothetical protein P170DRAFT_208403 [Aspergillus steynii IBT 23096]
MKPMRPAELTETNFRAHQLDLQDYKDTRNNIAKVEEAIKSSIAIHIQPLIEEKRRFEILKVLKEQYEPTEDEMEEKALRQYKAVIKRSPRKGKINAWIEDFDHAYLAIKRLNMSESQDKHVQKDFLRSIEAVDPLYSRLHYSNIRNTTYRNLLSDFRTYLANSGRDDDSAVAHNFATFNGQGDKPADAEKPQDAGKKGEGSSPYCVCGLRHRMEKCWQLYPDLRPPNWKLNSKAMKKLKDFAAGSSTQAQMVRSIIEKNWKQGDERPQEYHVMALSFSASLDIPLKNCFIIDTGS